MGGSVAWFRELVKNALNTFLWFSSVVVRKVLDYLTPSVGAGAGVGLALGSALVGEQPRGLHGRLPCR